MPITEFIDVPQAFIRAHYATLQIWLHNEKWDDLTFMPNPPEPFDAFVAHAHGIKREPVEHVTLTRSPRDGNVLVQPRNDASREAIARWEKRRAK